MPIEKLKTTLHKSKVRYESLAHAPAFTAQGIAAVAHVPGNELAKTVMVKLDGVLAMAVLPAPRNVNFDRLRQAAGAKNAELAHEDEFARLFPSCEVGAMPPFGNLYDLEVYVDEPLTHDEQIAFNTGTHTELIRMRYADYANLVKPKVCATSA